MIQREIKEKRSKLNIFKHRITAALLSVILLFADVTSMGTTVRAQESKLADGTVAQQETVEIEDDAEESPGDEEAAAGDTQIPDTEDSEDTPQAPDGASDGDVSQDPDGASDGDGLRDPGWESDGDISQDPDREGDEDKSRAPDGESGGNVPRDPDVEGDELFSGEENDTEEKTADAEDEGIIGVYSEAEEQDILSAEAEDMGGSYEEIESDITWSVDASGKLTIEGKGEFAAVSSAMDTGRAPWHERAAEIKTAEVRVSGMTDASGMFYGCSKLTKVDLSGFDTGSVTDMSYMFSGCVSLKTLDLGGFDVSAAEYMNNMFSDCSSLTSLDLSSFDAGRAKEMNDMFTGCSKLATIYTPRNVSLSVALPKAKSGDKWYRVGGITEITPPELPQDLGYSILLRKGQIPSVKAAELKVVKKTTAYMCSSEEMDAGDLKANYANADDLTVTHYDAAGNAYIIEASEDSKDSEDPEKSEGYKIDLEEPDGKEIDVRTPGKKILRVSYEGMAAEVELTFTYVMTNDNITIVMPQDIIYSGYPMVPVPTVTRTGDGEKLVEGRDYTVSYENNINAGEETAKVVIEGLNDYTNGEAPVTGRFTIKPASLTIQAGNVTLAVGDKLPEAAAFPYEAIGLSLGDEDQLKVTGYNFTGQQGESGNNIDTTNTGIYDVALLVDAGSNYEVESLKGKLVIAEERIGYAVTFDMMGHGDNIEIPGVMKAGSLLDIDELHKRWGVNIPTEGDDMLGSDENVRYVFDGWYKDKTFAAKQKWNFDTDTVQADTILYACWIEIPAVKGGAPLLSLAIQDIQCQDYTGSAIKPTVYVYSADGKALLKSGSDYTISYANNTNAVQADDKGALPAGGTASVTNPGKKNEEIENISGSFSKDYPYIIITGKGNYKETIYKNFYILPAKIASAGENGNMGPAEGFTLKYSDQLVTDKKKDQNPFSSFKYKKAMTLGKDYRITLQAESDVKCDESVMLEEGVVPSQLLAETGYIEKTKKYTAPVIPKGYSGTFTMTVEGVGNYQGKFEKTIVVTEKNLLMKNVSVTLGKNQKSMPYQGGKALTLQPGYAETVTADKKKQTLYYSVDKSGARNLVANTNDIFLVKAGSEYLVYGKDYCVSYTGNNKVGTAVMTITGMGSYMGTKSVTFKITGMAFNTKNVAVKTYDAKKPEDTAGCFMTSMTYTGTEIIQNNVLLTPKTTTADPDQKPFVYGTHFSISYKNNIKKGTATVTFTAKPESGYTGSFKKTFKITAQNLSNDMCYKDIVDCIESDDSQITRLKLKKALPYVRGGVKAAEWLDMSNILKNDLGSYLAMGTDYAVTYKNNGMVTTPDMAENKKPCMILTGKGNYTGNLTIYFDIDKAKISKDEIIVSQIVWNQKAKDTYEYKPKVKVVDGVSGKALGAGVKKDYVVAYKYNDQVNVTKYVLGEKDAVCPVAVITVPETSSYGLAADEAEKTADDASEIRVPLPIYKTKLTSSNLYVTIDAEQTVYTGERLMPDVEVYYGDTASVSKAKKDKVAYGEKETLTDANGNYKLRELTEKIDPVGEDGDYTLRYGANTAAGTNKGSVTVTGDSKEFGGSVTVKFDIVKKGIITVVPVVSFTLNVTRIRGEAGTEYQLVAENIQPAYATYRTIEWESADPQIASVDDGDDNGAGVSVSLKKEGMAIIRAYTDQRRKAEECLVFVDSSSEDEGTGFGGKYLTPQMYKNGDGSDYTDAFNRAIDYVGESGGYYDTVYVPAGTYMIDATKSINLDYHNNNFKIVMSDDAILKAIGNADDSYEVVRISGTGGVTISGGRIVGERNEHSGKSGEWGHGIGVYHSNDISIIGTRISECWGDGIYLGSDGGPNDGCTGITITGCELYDNRRNNLSIVCADDVKIDKCAFLNAHGTAPELGIDIETNYEENPCERITISNSNFTGNGQGSMSIISAANDIMIDGCTMNGMFVNWAGKNVVIKDSSINAEADARIGVTLVNTTINDGGSDADKLIAEFSAAKDAYTLGKYGADALSYAWVDDSDSTSASGRALRLRRDAEGTEDAGYYLDLGELSLDGSPILKNGVTYRFEYLVKGSDNSQWVIKTDQTGWYQCVPSSDKYSTGIVTYKAGPAESCRLLLYAQDRAGGIELKVDNIKIYEIR